MPLITQVVDMIAKIQADDRLRPLVFVVPVEVAAMQRVGWSPTALENEVQDILEKSLTTLLEDGPAVRSEPSDHE